MTVTYSYRRKGLVRFKVLNPAALSLHSICHRKVEHKTSNMRQQKPTLAAITFLCYLKKKLWSLTEQRNPIRRAALLTVRHRGDIEETNHQSFTSHSPKFMTLCGCTPSPAKSHFERSTKKFLLDPTRSFYTKRD